MPKLDRGLVYTLGLAALFLISAFGAWTLIDSASDLQARYEQASYDKAENYTRRADIAAERRCGPLAPEARRDCIREEAETAREGRHNEYDLAAQRATAVWTRYMGYAAIIGMAVGIFGLGLIFVTFRVTRQGAESAQNTYQAFIELERPRLMPRSGHCVYDHAVREVKLTLEAENIGRSTAYVTAVLWQSSNDSYAPTEDLVTKVRDVSVKADETIQTYIMRLDRAIIGTSYVRGIIVYRSPFRWGHRSYFCFKIDGQETRHGHKWKITREKLGKWPEDT